MDDNQFDFMTKSVGHAPTRRDALRLLTAVTGGGLAALLGMSGHDAGEAEKRKRSRKNARKQKQNRVRARERKRERRRSHRQSQPPTAPPETPPPTAPPEPPSGPCPDGKTACEGSCIPAGDCCTTADCPGNQVCRSGECGAPALYPNLRTLPVSDLSFDMHPSKETVHILRFANTVWNAGEGRLELESDVDSGEQVKPIYQNLYDAPVGGNRVERKRVASDFIFHPQHNHFHFTDFAEYLLLGRDATGVYRRMKTEGIKTSYCIMDTQRIEGSYDDHYTTCNADRQGLSPGWADTYRAGLYDQWVELGDDILSDGEYAVQSIADPRGLIDEGGGERENDNTAITYFTVKGGAIRKVRNQP